MIDYIRSADNLTVQEILKSSILFFFQSPPPDPKIVQIAPGFPVQNTPLKVRLYINLDAGVNSSSGMTTLTLSKVETFLDAFVQNASATLGVQVSGKETRLTIPWRLKKENSMSNSLINRGDVRVVMPLMTMLSKI